MIRKVAIPIEGDDVEKAITPLLREYLEHGQTSEVLVSWESHNSVTQGILGTRPDQRGPGTHAIMQYVCMDLQYNKIKNVKKKKKNENISWRKLGFHILQYQIRHIYITIQRAISFQ